MIRKLFAVGNFVSRDFSESHKVELKLEAKTPEVQQITWKEWPFWPWMNICGRMESTIYKTLRKICYLRFENGSFSSRLCTKCRPRISSVEFSTNLENFQCVKEFSIVGAQEWNFYELLKLWWSHEHSMSSINFINWFSCLSVFNPTIFMSNFGFHLRVDLFVSTGGRSRLCGWNSNPKYSEAAWIYRWVRMEIQVRIKLQSCNKMTIKYCNFKKIQSNCSRSVFSNFWFMFWIFLKDDFMQNFNQGRSPSFQTPSKKSRQYDNYPTAKEEKMARQKQQLLPQSKLNLVNILRWILFLNS